MVLSMHQLVLFLGMDRYLVYQVIELPKTCMNHHITEDFLFDLENGSFDVCRPVIVEDTCLISKTDTCMYATTRLFILSTLHEANRFVFILLMCARQIGNLTKL